MEKPPFATCKVKKMTGKDHRPEGNFGFARESHDGNVDAPSPVRLVHFRKDDKKPGSLASSPGLKRLDEAVSTPSQNALDNSWVMRPKDKAARKKKLTPLEMKASDIRINGTSCGSAPSQAQTPEGGRTSKRWLALALAGMTYIVGFAGLWSMVQGFDDAALLPVTPAGDERSVPPLDETIDVRDAGLDDLVHPRSRPVDLQIPSDVAGSNLQNQS